MAKGFKDNGHPAALQRRPWQIWLGNLIFGLETPAARGYNIFMIVMVVLSVCCVMLESEPRFHAHYGPLLRVSEWIFTLVFTIDYLGRIVSARRTLHYTLSFYGLIDLISILPSYLSLMLPGAQYLLVVRALRLLQLFRVFKLTRYLSEANILGEALQASRAKITVFMLTVVTLVLVFGTLMYLIEGPKNGFTSIPTSVYWAVVTISTVGYGDISPHTPLGKFVATLAMLFGYGIIAVPTGIVTAGLVQTKQAREMRICLHCGNAQHDADAEFCKRCGAQLPSGHEASQRQPPEALPTDPSPTPSRHL